MKFRCHWQAEHPCHWRALNAIAESRIRRMGITVLLALWSIAVAIPRVRLCNSHLCPFKNSIALARSCAPTQNLTSAGNLPPGHRCNSCADSRFALAVAHPRPFAYPTPQWRRSPRAHAGPAGLSTCVAHCYDDDNDCTCWPSLARLACTVRQASSQQKLSVSRRHKDWNLLPTPTPTRLGSASGAR